MKTARLAVGAIAIAAGGGAFMLFGRGAPPAPQIVQAAPIIVTDDVMVATRDIPRGSTLNAEDFVRRPWPRESITPAFVRGSDGPAAIEEIKGSRAISNFVAGDPIRRDKLVKGPKAGFLSMILPSGRRAVAISIDARGSNTAGNFILPDDRVDIINTIRDGDGSKSGAADAYVSKVILHNIKVLAIGPNEETKNGDKVVTGETATLELDPAQAQEVIRAQRTGQLSLTLRSMKDDNELTPSPPPEVAAAAPVDNDDKTITVIRYGVTAQAAKK